MPVAPLLVACCVLLPTWPKYCLFVKTILPQTYIFRKRAVNRARCSLLWRDCKIEEKAPRLHWRATRETRERELDREG